ncbi:nucleotidyltransferase domain-containing protein [Streptomyces sp. YIM S03343]
MCIRTGRRPNPPADATTAARPQSVDTEPAATPPAGATHLTRRALRATRSAARAVARSPFGFLVAFPVLQRDWIRIAPAADVLAVLDTLRRAEVRGWLAGGWGVDALLGLQTRRHGDVDVVLAWDGGVEERARSALAGLGFQPLRDQVFSDDRLLSVRWAVDDGLVVVDLLPVDLARRPFTALRSMRETSQTAAATVVTSADPAPDDCGVVSGHVVPCLPLRLQLAAHQGYPPRRSDRHDIALLQELLERRGISQ